MSENERRIADRSSPDLSPLAFHRLTPSEMAKQTTGYQRMSDAQREQVDDLLQSEARNEDFCRSVVGLLRSPGFVEATPALQGEIVTALGENPDARAVDRLRFLAEDARGWTRMDPAEQESLVQRTAEGSALTGPEDIALGSAIRREDAHHGHVLTAVTGAVHLGETALELAHPLVHGAAAASAAVEIVAGACAGVGIVLFTVEAVEGIERAHEDGDRQAETIARGQAFVAAFEDLVASGEADPSYGRAGDTRGTREAREEGAGAANQLWKLLDPAQRAQLRAMTPTEQHEFHEVLARDVERQTISGE